MRGRPAILVVCSSWPHGRAFGGQLRTLHTLRALAELGRVAVAMIGADADDTASAQRTREEFEVLLTAKPGVCYTRSLQEKLRRAFDPRYLNIHGLATSPKDRANLEQLIEKVDLVWVINARTPNIVQRWDWPRAHLDLDDVPSTYLRSRADAATHPAARLKARCQQMLLKRRELRLPQRFTTLSTCSAQDRDYLGGSDRIHVIPNGFDVPSGYPERTTNPKRPRLGFIGLCSYAPNADGIQWFIQRCWPTIQRTVPAATLRIIGKDAGKVVPSSVSGVEALGWLADPAAEFATWSATVVPIRFGGGTRIKIAEAFSRKCPVVSTSLGAYGYEVSHGKHLLLADDPNSFSEACVDLLTNAQKGCTLAENAWTEYLRKWTWNAISPKVWAAAEDCLRRSDNIHGQANATRS